MTSTGERILFGNLGTIICEVFEHTEISVDLYEAFQQSQVATPELKPSATADPDSMVRQVGIITPVGAAHDPDAVHHTPWTTLSTNLVTSLQLRLTVLPLMLMTTMTLLLPILLPRSFLHCNVQCRTLSLGCPARKPWDREWWWRHGRWLRRCGLARPTFWMMFADLFSNTFPASSSAPAPAHSPALNASSASHLSQEVPSNYANGCHDAPNWAVYQVPPLTSWKLHTWKSCGLTGILLLWLTRMLPFPVPLSLLRRPAVSPILTAATRAFRFARPAVA